MLRDREVSNDRLSPPQSTSGEKMPEKAQTPDSGAPAQPGSKGTLTPDAGDFAWLKVDSIDGIISLDAETLDYPEIMSRWKAVITGYRGIFAEKTEKV